MAHGYIAALSENVERRYVRRKRLCPAGLIIILLCLLLATPAAAQTKTLTLRTGQTRQLKASERWRKIKWKSSNARVASVNARGRVTARRAGQAFVTAKSGRKRRVYCIMVRQSEQIAITVGGKTFYVTPEKNQAAKAFMELLPLTLDMSELNGNEKYHYLDTSLPADATRPGTIHAGDLMLYGSDCVVLFHQTFTSSYSYTRLGHISDPEGLAAALGRGGVSVTFRKRG